MLLSHRMPSVCHRGTATGIPWQFPFPAPGRPASLWPTRGDEGLWPPPRRQPPTLLPKPIRTAVTAAASPGAIPQSLTGPNIREASFVTTEEGCVGKEGVKKGSTEGRQDY